MIKTLFFLLLPDRPSSLACIFVSLFWCWSLCTFREAIQMALCAMTVCNDWLGGSLAQLVWFMFSKSYTTVVLFLCITFFSGQWPYLQQITIQKRNKQKVRVADYYHYFVLPCKLMSSPAFPNHEPSCSSPGALLQKKPSPKIKTVSTWIMHFLCHEFSQNCRTSRIRSWEWSWVQKLRNLGEESKVRLDQGFLYKRQ